MAERRRIFARDEASKTTMEYRLLGGSGLKVSELSFGALTFGGVNEFFKGFGETEVDEARRMIDICFEAGVNLFDTADGYSEGRSEEILGKALAGKRDKALISTKVGFPTGEGPNELGSSHYYLRRALEASLRRLGTDYIDIYHLHCFDAMTPIEETQDTLNTFVREGKVRYIACSNFSGWHLMKSLAVADRYGWTRFVAHQVYYLESNAPAYWQGSFSRCSRTTLHNHFLAMGGAAFDLSSALKIFLDCMREINVRK